MEYDTIVVTLGKRSAEDREVEGLKLTLHRKRDEVSACLRTLLGSDSKRRKGLLWRGHVRTLDQSSMSSSPAVVVMMTLPLVGRAIGSRKLRPRG